MRLNLKSLSFCILSRLAFQLIDNVSHPCTAEPHRTTPLMFFHPHVRASFGPAGQLVRVAANRPRDGQPAILEIQELGQLLGNSREAQEMREFPGPLVKCVLLRYQLLSSNTQAQRKIVQKRILYKNCFKKPGLECFTATYFLNELL